MNTLIQSVSRRSSVAAARRGGVLRSLCVSLVAGLGFAGIANAGFLTVPNGDFSALGNAGSVGGGVIGASGTNVLIGSGPWTGTYNGVLTLLVPPTLAISPSLQTATISGLLGINAVGIVNNGGHFGQTLSNNVQSNKRYTTIVDMDASGLLDIGLISAAGVGVSLHAGASTLISSDTAAAGPLRADLLGASTVRVQMYHDTATVAAAPLGLQLFDRPQGLLTASLVDSVSFSNVRLAETTIPSGNSTLTVSGGGSQSAPVGQPFPQSLTAIVRDQNGDPVPDTLVTLTAPAEGASATLHAGTESGRVIVAVTDASGQITFSADANEISGCYIVTGEVPGIDSLAIFHMRNYSQAQIAAYMAAHPGVKGMPQDSIFCNGFE
ncbi:hypothetical protein [Tahibacter caeni]|uniref:hypothetical protein n=1 Tax=Tahibacter caeni TaxID=1453545 RepID=UPI0021487974|nr:hypothetical protein [Tahibacter caeni]